MREHGHQYEGLTGWLYQFVGIALCWLQAHGLGLVGILSIAFGMWLNYKRYLLTKRETDVRIQVYLGQSPPPPSVKELPCRS